MGRLGLHTVVPDKVFQRGHMLTWSHAQKDALLASHGITVVVNLWNKIDPDLSDLVDVYLYWPIRGNQIPPETYYMVDTVALLVQEGHRVLVHCEAGVNRSVWFSARVAKRLGTVPELPRRTKLNPIFEANLGGGA